MQEPKAAGREPVSVEVKAGKTYFWCACGLSRNQPFCDGSHKGTGFAPVKWEAKADGAKFFCTCKRTSRPPFCDGSHKALEG
ncbi:CDGSH iron-sulfur domain-containing protein [Oceanicella actignis]|uniref:Iron-binding zinc finger CDGSH type n=1 Tax=Oceanicella actignis TaxID=1189325 RepID=A0A1M7SDN6_9RHOB|nr:CDGSH iron-sulfur domain-containing protein [Oceanicella actignis]TYO91376.1 iron-binding CDGSH zinc finger protein [Oceanicella actignis]SET24858.1 Iron-binding zinc finger CDGSH type [Oceanicella actignis]SHN56565.1 Iron-binding zinc finger CDGSH type [Oceanicella actignis]